MKGKKRIKMLLLAGLVSAGLLSGCGGQTDSGESESGGSSGELVLYTWEGMFPQEVLDGFEEETGIELIYSNFDTDETMLEKLAQAEGKDYDLVIADDYIIESVVEEGLAQKLDKSKIENFDNINPLYQGQFYDEDLWKPVAITNAWTFLKKKECCFY